MDVLPPGPVLVSGLPCPFSTSARVSLCGASVAPNEGLRARGGERRTAAEELRVESTVPWIYTRPAMKTLPPHFALALLLAMTGCSSSPAAPNSTGSALNLSGSWSGTGTDAQGPEKFRWALAQTGSTLTGTAILDPADTADGSCGSCHKQKTGTVTGTISGTALTLTLDFPKGGSDLTPLCGITMTATTSDVAAGRIAAAYTGTTTCEGPITDGTLVVTR